MRSRRGRGRGRGTRLTVRSLFDGKFTDVQTPNDLRVILGEKPHRQVINSNTVCAVINDDGEASRSVREYNGATIIDSIHRNSGTVGNKAFPIMENNVIGVNVTTGILKAFIVSARCPPEISVGIAAVGRKVKNLRIQPSPAIRRSVRHRQ